MAFSSNEGASSLGGGWWWACVAGVGGGWWFGAGWRVASGGWWIGCWVWLVNLGGGCGWWGCPAFGVGLTFRHNPNTSTSDFKKIIGGRMAKKNRKLPGGT